jgi:hypothetical protein
MAEGAQTRRERAPSVAGYDEIVERFPSLQFLEQPTIEGDSWQESVMMILMLLQN